MFIGNYSDFTTTERAEYRLLVSDTTLSYSLLQFNNVLTLYGGSVTFERKETEERRRRRETRDEPMCLIVWLSDTNVPVLISDSANGYSNNRIIISISCWNLFKELNHSPSIAICRIDGIFRILAIFKILPIF